jgi:hypothetical protein
LRTLLISTAVAVALSVPAVAEENTTWKDLQYWHIGVTGDTHGCFMMTSYGNANTPSYGILRMDLGRDEKALRIVFTRDNWQSLQPGRDYQ